MSRSIVFRQAARAELIRSIKWYDDRRAGLGDEFETEVNSVLDTIAEHPDRYPIADGEVRVAKVHRFPFGVYYRIRSGWIVIISVFHESRDPSEWQSRS